MDSPEPDTETPLLSGTTSPGSSRASDYHSVTKPHASVKAIPSGGADPLRSLEDDVLPETAVPGRNLGWSSAYILIISRTIGSGIFAVPGSIVDAAGSIGLSLLLWVVGALISWAGLVISLEFGCMLPRSGGQ